MSTPSLTSTHVLKNGCERCAELEARIQQIQIGAEVDLASLATQLAQKQHEIDRLLADVGERRKQTTKKDREAYELWLQVHGKDPEKKANAFGPAAQAGLSRARRAGLEQDDILKVIRTHGRYPCLHYGAWAEKGQRKDKLSDAFKNEDRWGALLELADAKPPPSPRSYNLLGTIRKDDYPSHGFQRPVDNLVTALERADCKPWQSTEGQGSAHCPIHDDRQKSFRFKESDAGTVLLYCQACASHFVTNEAFCDQVRQVLQLPLTDLYPNRKAA